MKNSLFIVMLLSSVLSGEAMASALLFNQHDVCIVDLGADGEAEAEKDTQEKDAKLQIKLAPKIIFITDNQHQNLFNYLNISQQVSREVVTPPPRFS